jgi:pimeloyl-ACP methyl ester carboxylesterase
VQNSQYALPESELRQLFVANPDGTMGAYKGSTKNVDNAIGEGQKKRDYSRIRVPVLAIRGLVLQPLDDQLRASGYRLKSNEERANIEAFNRVTAAHLDGWVTNLKSGVPDARLVDFPRAGHYVFLTQEADVLREIRAFIARLP